ncbi:hypothetical protein J421_2239 [Gemmatirosa kalamazoonensis]|uniref:Uncharacterized protein n=1 Tax=Gemmatirosa kalamazoonensis TaxID=861299 RepID=W0RG78_9BACT|nr:hypothetical protein J421_2239 [Gemmatirosa kalamazoonensis]
MLRRAAERAVASNPAPEPARAAVFPALHTPPWAHAIVYGERRISGMAADAATVEPWMVRELDARAVPAARGPRCLVFENPRLVRRIWDYPTTWLSLSDRALLAVAGLAP